ncbi:hypothetical protein OBRU01_23004 [Operophtera brumata]|uniref:Uncharacterized protein n=1 Tax=Operophtera brumata TaxID=104452 RepID=A0A0L7KQM2_OPEBR|nr:hypothetical protein OBRU01_23004 [Operophtera brumata]
MSSNRSKTSFLDKPLSKGKGEVSLAFYALLFSEMVQYCQNKSHSIQELQNKQTIRYWPGCGLESIGPVNKFISVPKDKGSLNCATFNAGIIEAVLTKGGFDVLG